MNSLIPLALMAVMMWMLLIRPQQQRVRRQQALVSSLGVGDRVVTAGGMIGEIVAVDGDRVSIELAPGTVVQFLRAAVSQRLDGGSPDAIEAASITDEDEDS